MAEGVLCRPLKTSLAHMSTDLDFVDGMKWGLSFMINPDRLPRPALGQQPHLGRAGELLLLDRSGEEGDRRLGDPAPAFLRPARDRRV